VSAEQLATVLPRARSERREQRALVLRAERRQGGHRYDYLLRFRDGWEGWFADDEVALKRDEQERQS
jgi:hypothetical protein